MELARELDQIRGPRGRAAWPIDRRLSRLIEKTDSCWLWIGARSSNGYGTVRYDKRWYRAHRFVYEHLVGPIAEGLDLDHLCRVRHCMNPAHLEPVTREENLRRSGGNQMQHRTHCKHGHPFEGENLGWRIRNGKKHRVCLACQGRERDGTE